MVSVGFNFQANFLRSHYYTRGVVRNLWMVSKQCGRLFLSSLKQNEIYSKLICLWKSSKQFGPIRKKPCSENVGENFRKIPLKKFTFLFAGCLPKQTPTQLLFKDFANSLEKCLFKFWDFYSSYFLEHLRTTACFEMLVVKYLCNVH